MDSLLLITKKVLMTLYFHVFCTTLTNGRIAWSVMHQLDWPFVVLVNRRSMLSITNQLRLSFVVLPNGVRLFCSVPESMHSRAKMITSLTTAFETAFPIMDIRWIDEFLSTFGELTKVIVILLLRDVL